MGDPNTLELGSHGARIDLSEFGLPEEDNGLQDLARDCNPSLSQFNEFPDGFDSSQSLASRAQDRQITQIAGPNISGDETAWSGYFFLLRECLAERRHTYGAEKGIYLFMSIAELRPDVIKGWVQDPQFLQGARAILQRLYNYLDELSVGDQSSYSSVRSRGIPFPIPAERQQRLQTRAKVFCHRLIEVFEFMLHIEAGDVSPFVPGVIEMPQKEEPSLPELMAEVLSDQLMDFVDSRKEGVTEDPDEGEEESG